MQLLKEISFLKTINDVCTYVYRFNYQHRAMHYSLEKVNIVTVTSETVCHNSIDDEISLTQIVITN